MLMLLQLQCDYALVLMRRSDLDTCMSLLSLHTSTLTQTS